MTDTAVDGMDGFDGFAVLEEAALMMIGASPEQADELLKIYRFNLERLLLENIGDPRQAAAVADRFVGIIVQRRREIELSTGANRTDKIQ